jgi:amidase
MLTDAISHAGPMARTVADLELILSVIRGPDGLDTRIQPVPVAAASTVRLAGLRCAVMVDNGAASPDEETAAVVEGAAAILARAGVNMRRDRLDGVAETTAVGGGFWAVGAGAAVRTLLDQAGTPPADYANNWFRRFSTSAEAPIPAAALVSHLARFEDYRRRMARSMARYDVLISPVNAHPAPMHPAPGESPFPSVDASYTEAYDLTGWPAGVVRGGTSSTGVPIGVQVVANPWREDIVLAVMRHLEDALSAFGGPSETLWES